MRLFLAINIPEEIKNVLARKLRNLEKRISQDVKWVKRENWHITLKFIGEAERRDIDFIKKNMMIIANNTMQQPISFSRVAAFPHLDTPRVFYLGVEKGSKEICDIYKDLDFLLKDHFLKGEKKTYTPHLTLARLKKNSKIDEVSNIIKEYTDLDFGNVSFLMDRISLMNSILRKDGPVYEEIYSANFVDK
ncbi:MAG: RNA 2',3'-cyclic phosphodiesterase [Halanaerobiaceae bacterium]|nr:RNA 2',3'-cyclic phosphodiesterase [Halanaerobiaceae bacterium]